MRWTKFPLILAVLWSPKALAEQREALRAPVTTTCISSPFGPRVLPNHPQAGIYHYGVDLPAPEGAPVRATASGVLLRVQRKGRGGLEVLLQHAGFVGVYSHLSLLEPKLEAGGNVHIKGGERLGAVGHTGVSSGPHLYFAMLRHGQPVDPAPLLNIPLCRVNRPHRPDATGPADEAPPAMATSGEQPLPSPRSSLLDDFPPIRGCSIEAMIRIVTRQFNVERSGSPYGQTGIARYQCSTGYSGEERFR
jgi:peptidase M23-like protein